MRVIAKRTLRKFWEKHPDCEEQLKTWYDDANKANWETPNDIKKQYGPASILGNKKVVFNIKGNDYRLIVKIEYDFGVVYIKFIGTHNEYDKIDVTKI